MKAGAAPCDGVVMARADAQEFARRSAKVDLLEAEKGELAVKLETAEKKLLAEREACEGRVGACNGENAELRRLLKERGDVKEVPVVERPWFVATIAVVVTAAVAVPVTWLAVTTK